MVVLRALDVIVVVLGFPGNCIGLAGNGSTIRHNCIVVAMEIKVIGVSIVSVFFEHYGSHGYVGIM